jgi:ribosomal protein S18 acetylase RimI-like enzyme
MAAITTSIFATPPQLRPLNILRDLPAVADLVENCFADTMDAEGRRYIQQLRRSSQDNAFLRWASTAVETTSMPLAGYVWVENNEIVGNASLIPFRHEARKYYLVANVAVRPEYRRKGIGRTLTLAAMQHARQKHASAIWLHVRDDNPGAIELYSKLGFVEQARRTTWHAKPDRNASPDGLGMTFSNHPARDWSRQESWLRRLYPELIAWYQTMPWTTLRPGFGPALYRFFVESEVKNWTVRTGNRLDGVLTWQPLYGANDRLWAAVPSEGASLALSALLLRARRDLSWRQGLTLEFPAGEYRSAIEAAGFHPLRTLLWMCADETANAGLRT